jgi:hypothetical protein
LRTGQFCGYRTDSGQQTAHGNGYCGRVAPLEAPYTRCAPFRQACLLHHCSDAATVGAAFAKRASGHRKNLLAVLRFVFQGVPHDKRVRQASLNCRGQYWFLLTPATNQNTVEQREVEYGWHQPQHHYPTKLTYAVTPKLRRPSSTSIDDSRPMRSSTGQLSHFHGFGRFVAHPEVIQLYV